MDPIDRQAAISAVNTALFPKINTAKDAEKALLNLPSVDVQTVRHGHWVYGEDDHGIDGYHCNKCGFFVPWDYTHKFINFIEDYNYCPHCNARMGEVTSGD